MPSVGSGSRVPPGGDPGSFLSKKTTKDFDYQWIISPTGPKGDQGDPGAAGPKGDVGAVGPKGDQGDRGLQGAEGVQGVPGVKGDTGAAGAKGDTGTQGVKGDTGAAGAKGDTGLQGVKGDTGLQGVKGDTGTQGVKGDTGAAGPGVPVGGTSGQVLTKNSATNYDTTWKTPSTGGSSGSGGFPAWRADRLYIKPTPNNFASMTIPNSITTYFFQGWIPNAITITRMSIYIGAAAAGTMALGLWADSGPFNFNPGVRLATATFTPSGPGLWGITTMSVPFTGPTPVWISLASTGTSTIKSTPSTAALITQIQDLGAASGVALGHPQVKTTTAFGAASVQPTDVTDNSFTWLPATSLNDPTFYFWT